VYIRVMTMVLQVCLVYTCDDDVVTGVSGVQLYV